MHRHRGADLADHLDQIVHAAQVVAAWLRGLARSCDIVDQAEDPDPEVADLFQVRRKAPALFANADDRGAVGEGAACRLAANPFAQEHPDQHQDPYASEEPGNHPDAGIEA